MKILIVGNGGREHALLWKLQRDAPDAEFWVTRPNGGMRGATDAEVGPEDVEGVLEFASSIAADLTVVGPEAPLAEGLVDRLEGRGLRAFGPRAGAARIEASKAFAKDLMVAAGIPTAAHRTFAVQFEAEDWVRTQGAPIVVKASGLAAGKGAIVCSTVPEALGAIDAMMNAASFGAAGAEVVIEEFMEGEELSFFCLVSGEEVMPMIPSQDHKRIGVGDTGPNTGGMGAYSPVSLATAPLIEGAIQAIVAPTARALAERGDPFHGLLYAGLMLTPNGPKVVEFNCRFGDPETQVVLPLLQSSLLDPLLAVAERSSISGPGAAPLEWSEGAAVTTVLASGGYPGPYTRGHQIDIPDGLEDAGDVIVFHAGTSRSEEQLVTSGGRVLAATGLGESIEDAASRSRAAASAIQFAGRQFRTDIGWREIARKPTDRAASKSPS